VRQDIKEPVDIVEPERDGEMTKVSKVNLESISSESLRIMLGDMEPGEMREKVQMELVRRRRILLKDLACGKVDLESVSSESLRSVLLDMEPGEMREKVRMELLRKYEIFLKEMAESNYKVVGGELVVIEPTLSLIEKKEVKMINIALGEVRAAIDDGTKVLVKSEENRYIVTFEFKLPEGAMGPDYSFKVVIDAETGKVLKIWAGG
jgi:hypothetical protein